MTLKTINKKIQNRSKKAKKIKPYLIGLKKPLDEKAFLLEAGQGKNTNGNVFALLRYLRQQSRFDDYKIYLSVRMAAEEAAAAKLANYGIKNVELVRTESPRYRHLLATVKYLVTDNSFPLYLNKRDDQVYCNTWHGTPLKALGRTDIANSASLANVQANFLKADYLLHPNEYTKDIMMRDYMVERLYKHKTVVTDYPRNDTLFNRDCCDEILEKYSLKGKRLIAYMPTWRGTGRKADIEIQILEAQNIIRNIDAALHDDEMLCVNLHFLIGNEVDLTGLQHTMTFPSEYETYDFLAACDTLITDYSSVCIDFAGTGRDVILYTYDYDEYMRDKGFYYDVRRLPFRQANTFEELEAQLHAPHSDYELDSVFYADNKGCSCEKLINLMVDGDENGLNIQDYSAERGTVLAYFENIVGDMNQRMLECYLGHLTDEEKRNTVLTFGNRINRRTVEVLNRMIPRDMDFMRVDRRSNKDRDDFISTITFKRTGKMRERADAFYEREARRLFGSLNISRIDTVQCLSIDRNLIIAKAAVPKTLYKHPSYFYGRNGDMLTRRRFLYEHLVSQYDDYTEFTPEEMAMMWDGLRCFGFKAEVRRIDYKLTETDLQFTGNMSLRADRELELSAAICLSDTEYPVRLDPKVTIENDDIRVYNTDFEFSIPVEDMEAFIKDNPVFFCLTIDGGRMYVPVLFPEKGGLKDHPYILLNDTGMICLARNKKGRLALQIRPANKTDAAGERAKVWFAWFLSRLTPFYRPIILCEKESSRYEESASIVYEKLIDMGYKNVRFILDPEYPHKDSIDPKYRGHIVDRLSFRHYYDLFSAKTVISTEAISHTLELNSMSKTFKKYVLSGSQNYVFLQHGVMYMVSLNSEGRTYFRRNRPNQRVVTSSLLEKKHFTGFTNYSDGHVYVSGLPKFDYSRLNDGADRIVVMLTWRPWEYNQAVIDFTQTSYCQMLSRIIQAVPEKYKDKLIVLPHPKLADIATKHSELDIWKYSVLDEKYDDILKKTKLLITDYSSISYDAFYRGSNIIFCWGEKDECMQQYGPSTTLMLTEDLAFGPVSYDENIGGLIEKMYNCGQSEEYLERYSKIVTYHDGRNTERVIEMMKEDGFI